MNSQTCGTPVPGSPSLSISPVSSQDGVFSQVTSSHDLASSGRYDNISNGLATSTNEKSSLNERSILQPCVCGLCQKQHSINVQFSKAMIEQDVFEMELTENISDNGDIDFRISAQNGLTWSYTSTHIKTLCLNPRSTYESALLWLYPWIASPKKNEIYSFAFWLLNMKHCGKSR